MESFLACFGCETKSNSVISPQIVVTKSAKKNKYQKLVQQQKQKTVSTLTFRQQESNLKTQQITKLIQTLKKLTPIERKKIEMDFIKKNSIVSQQMYLIEKKWSEQYTNYLAPESKSTSMRQINNTRLLEGEKLAVGISEKIDYYIVSQKIWQYINRMYGGGPVVRKSMLLPTSYIPVAGIKNNYYFCYLNTGIQILFSIQQFVHYFKNKLYKALTYQTKISQRKIFCIYTNKVIKQLSDVTGQSKDLHDFSELFSQKFSINQQHDCQEFLRYYLEKIQDETNPIYKLQKFTPKNAEHAYQYYLTNHPSIIDQIFYGQNTNTVKCEQCQNISINYQTILQLFVQINKQTLQDCLQNYFSEEHLQDLYDCPKCKKKTNALKKLTISKTPLYLMITLKRFTSSKTKNSDFIGYPLKLNIQDYCTPEAGKYEYNLQSIVVHKGAIQKGHYYCLTRRGKKWYYINDQTVKEISIQKELKQQAYILIYQREK